VLKNAYFLKKKRTKSAAVSGAPPLNPRVATPSCYFNFVGFIPSTKFVLLLSKKYKITTWRQCKNISCLRGKGTLATSLIYTLNVVKFSPKHWKSKLKSSFLQKNADNIISDWRNDLFWFFCYSNEKLYSFILLFFQITNRFLLIKKLTVIYQVSTSLYCLSLFIYYTSVVGWTEASQDKTRQGRFYNTHVEIRLVLSTFDVVPFDVDKFVDFPEFCSFISPNHCF